ncbi:MAG: AbrB/MazE/SpoVT family DNA-binding domain-containing protein [Patescibacteria group bacterium]|nr:AbrB/MazE/SpoVT family DNA-binding domain-containing protein [Patescibacteria group bacterium]
MLQKNKTSDLITLAKIKKHHQITLPYSLRKKFNLDEGDYVKIENRNQEIIIKPIKIVHPDQEYFYTKEWQKDEADADKDIAKNKITGPFKTADDLFQELEG